MKTRINIFLELLIILPLLNCSIFQLREYKNFSEWYFGRPGLKNTFEITNLEECYKNKSEVLIRIKEERHFLYLHFRTPEIFWNPQGWIYFPKFRRDCMNYDGQEGGIKYLEFYDIFTCERNYKKGSYPVFQGGLQGIIDTLIPYRSYTAKDWDEKEKVTATIFSPLLVAGSFFIYIGIELPVYFSHDIIKTISIPFARLYYLNRNDPIE